MKSVNSIFIIILSLLLLSACGASKDETSATQASNRSPVISGSPSLTARPGIEYSFSPNATDADGDSLGFTIQNLPAWCSFDTTTGYLRGTPSTSDLGVYQDIIISVTDGEASTSLAQFTISVSDSNHTPTINGTPITSVDEGVSYSFTPIASDTDGDSLSYTISNLPNWANFDSNTGTLSGTPDYESAGEYTNITITVNDGSVTAELSPFSIAVNNVNRAPIITGTPLTGATENQLYSFSAQATDPDNDTITFSVLNLPAWATFNTSSGLLSGTPLSSHIGDYYNIIITASDDTDTATLQSFDIRVSPSTPSPTNVIFVDQQIGSNFCSDYDISSRTCGSGNSHSYKSITDAATTASSGDTVEIRSGTYNEQLAPENSGTISSPIIFRSYENEAVTITGSSLTPAIVISDKSYLIIDGLEVTNVRRWMYAINAHHNIIRNNTFSNALDSGGSSKTGLFFQESSHNKVINNVIDNSTQDNISLIKSDYNLISQNTIVNAAHTLWAIKCGNYNIIKENYFHNPEQKIGEVYDCDDVGFDHEFFIQDSTKHNVIEFNTFAKTSTYYSTSGGNGIQYAGQNGIVRFNTFYDNNVGIGMQRYSPEALHNKHNRIYHNTFYENHCGGIATTSHNSANYIDNIFNNNILTNNVECSGTKPFQLVYRYDLEGFTFENNNLSSGNIPDDVIGEWQGSGNTLSWFEANHPNYFKDNMEIDPLFDDEANLIFTLQSSSPMIDAGIFLTNTIGSGTGTTILLNDASFFHNGFGISGVEGDRIQLQGSNTVLTIESIDYNNNTITVDKEISWQSNQGVSLEYNGSAPDIGAFEY
jgi:parallel beta-helix repeat protein